MATESIAPLAVYLLAAALIVGGMLVLSFFLGERHVERATGVPFESGIQPTGSARLRVSTKFYLIAILFVIFDLEAAFLFAWSVAARELGWPGYFEALIFAGVLLLALAHLVKAGVLDWSRTRRR
jgi:NADH-quinone oxidoreductase subunit A